MAKNVRISSTSAGKEFIISLSKHTAMFKSFTYLTVFKQSTVSCAKRPMLFTSITLIFQDFHSSKRRLNSAPFFRA